VQLPKSTAGKFADVTGNSLPGITAAVTNVERGWSNPLYEFFKSRGEAVGLPACGHKPEKP
jgi:hypothetical protein